MADCELLKKCLFFNDKLDNMPSAAKTLKDLYCRWNFAKCARYKVATAVGKENVPADLFPGDFRQATDFLVNYSMVNNRAQEA